MEKGLLCFLQKQQVFLVSRFLRIAYGFIVVFLFSDDYLYKLFFKIEPLIPFCSIIMVCLSSYLKLFLNARLLGWFILIYEIIFSFNHYALILSFLVFSESLVFVFTFNEKRDLNLLVEIIQTLVLYFFVFVSFLLGVGFSFLVLIILFVSLLKLEYYISVSEVQEVDEYTKKSIIALPRHLFQVGFRGSISMVSLDLMVMIFLRIVNQITLFVWSYLRSVDGRHNFVKLYVIDSGLKVFVVIVLLLLLTIFSFFIDDSISLKYIIFGINILLLLIIEYNYLRSHT